MPRTSDPRTSRTSSSRSRISRCVDISTNIYGYLRLSTGIYVQVPSNREVEVINKWRDVDRAHEQLEAVREAHHRKLAEYEARWGRLEAGQLKIKQNLVKFNNFVKEKQLKIEEGAQRSKKHSQVFQMKAAEVSVLELQRETLSSARAQLEWCVAQLSGYRVFLDSVDIQYTFNRVENVHI